MEALGTRLHKLGVLAPRRRPGEAREDNLIFASPGALVTALGGNRHFRRDTALGRIFHPAKISYREISASDSLHLVFDGDMVAAHIDLLSPLTLDPQRHRQYSTGRVIAHTVTGFIGTVVPLFRHDRERRRTMERPRGVAMETA